jgi:hypothetical protein
VPIICLIFASLTVLTGCGSLVQILKVLIYDLGCPVVFSAGNQAYQANRQEVDKVVAKFLRDGLLDELILAGAMDGNGRRAFFSQYFPDKNVQYPKKIFYAPGMEIDAPIAQPDVEAYEDWMSYKKTSGTSLGKWSIYIYHSLLDMYW